MLALAAALAIGATINADGCPDVLDYSTWAETADQKWDYRSSKLVVLGAVHSRDPSHEQFARIATAFATARPTLAFFEGPDRGTRDSAETAIRETGESGYVRYLAASANVPSRSLEPSPPQQIKMLLGQYPVDQVMLFFIVREAVRLRDREGLSGPRLEAAVGKMFEKIAPMEAALGVPLPFKDTPGLQAAFAAYWPGRDWKRADSAWFSPTADDRKTGGVFTAAINRADSTNRNRHLANILGEAVRKGERPFVVIGRNHVPMITPAIDCALKRLQESGN
ncbi:MAG TPA: hypothetical protein VD768_08950 [Sphingomicrobium sp.]|nr:hypothetical protein [Sphingomicrobium sp.]